MGEAAADEDVYCTLCLSDSYLPGAAVLAKSLRDAGTQKKLACIVVQANLRHAVMMELQSLFNYVISVDAIGNPQPANLYLMGRPDLQFTFTKVHLWRQTQFRKIVYVDSDVVALRAPDELFDLPDSFAAVPDVGWPDAFNSGVMVLAPNTNDYSALRSMADAGDSFDGADQGLLNQYFEHRPWKRLSFTYNCTPNGYYQYEPAYRYYKHGISMVHFIGAEKPWLRGRTAEGSPGAFQELLHRWWATYDRHFKVSTTDYVYGQRELAANVVQGEVHEKGLSQEKAYYATGYPVESTGPAPPPEAQAVTTEAPFTDPEYVGESLDQGHTGPPSTVDVRRFSAPTVEWDATRAAPPSQSRPEGASLSVQNYEFNYDPQPFRPPTSYPEPPKGMWYDVPKTPVKAKEEQLPPLFPWEEKDRPAPTRKFVDDEISTPPPSDQEFRGADEFEVQMDTKIVEPKTPTIRINDQTPWNALGAISRNAWDEVSGIENYVRALTAHQKSRGKVQILYQDPQPSSSRETAATSAASAKAATAALVAAAAEMSPTELVEQVQKRRESLILTDFPTAVERPSLPVTPAPIRRTTFWGPDGKGEDEEEAVGDAAAGVVGGTATAGETIAAPGTAGMPPAEGVPNQADWNPSTQLEQLRRNSLLVGPEDLQFLAQNNIPDRGLPASASVPAVTSPPADVERRLGTDGSMDFTSSRIESVADRSALSSDITSSASSTSSVTHGMGSTIGATTGGTDRSADTSRGFGSAIGATTGAYTGTDQTASSQTSSSATDMESSRSSAGGATDSVVGGAVAAATVGLGLGFNADERYSSSTTTRTSTESTYDQREGFDERTAESTYTQRDSLGGGSAEVTPRQERRQFFDDFQSDTRGSTGIADTSRLIGSETFTGGSRASDSSRLTTTSGSMGTTETFAGGLGSYGSRDLTSNAGVTGATERVTGGLESYDSRNLASTAGFTGATESLTSSTERSTSSSGTYDSRNLAGTTSFTGATDRYTGGLESYGSRDLASTTGLTSTTERFASGSGTYGSRDITSTTGFTGTNETLAGGLESYGSRGPATATERFTSGLESYGSPGPATATEIFTGGLGSYSSRDLASTSGFTGTTERLTGGSEIYQSNNFSNTGGTTGASETTSTFRSGDRSLGMGTSFIDSSAIDGGVSRESLFNIRSGLESSLDQQRSSQLSSSYENGLGFREVQVGEESSTSRRDDDTLRGDFTRQVDLSSRNISDLDTTSQQRFDSSVQTSNSAITTLQDERENQRQLLRTEEGYSRLREGAGQIQTEDVREQSSQTQTQTQAGGETTTQESTGGGGSGMFRSYVVASSSSASQISESSSTGSWES